MSSCPRPCRNPYEKPRKLGWFVFPLARPLPSTASAPFCPDLFGGFFGTMSLSDFPASFIDAVRPLAFSSRPGSPSSGRCRDLPCPVQRDSHMPRLFDRVGGSTASRYRQYPFCLLHPRTASASQIVVFAAQSPRPVLPRQRFTWPSRASAHDSGPSWVATPSMSDSFIPFSLPIFKAHSWRNESRCCRSGSPASWRCEGRRARARRRFRPTNHRGGSTRRMFAHK